jgi:RNA-directed DNA polymerase
MDSRGLARRDVSTAGGDAGRVPTPGGGARKLGLPTVLDRCFQQAVLQVLPPEWDKPCSESSGGFRPGR